MSESHQADGYNAGYADQLYERTLRDRGVIPPSLADPSSNGSPVPSPPTVPDRAVTRHVLRSAAAAGALAEDYRTHGHLLVPVDPLGAEPPGHPAVRLGFHGVSESDLADVPAAAIGLERLGDTALDVVRSLHRVYCERIGYELDHMDDVDQWNWLVEYIETERHFTPLSTDGQLRVLEILTEVEGFERFLHRAYLGQKRFSIEGLDMMIPMLGSAVRLAVRAGTKRVFLGMAHRGRLSVLSRLIGRPYEAIMADFEGDHGQGMQSEVSGTGDVKYHLGARVTVTTSAGEIEVQLAPNPSHLEHVNPVLEGMARAAREQLVQARTEVAPGDRSRFDEFHGTDVLPILVHGDSAFIGQGVVAETMNLCRLPGYETGGTLHIVANNQLGFTTDPEDSRSTRYASDLALAFRMPILHVNADDPEACLAAIRLGMDYRTEFGEDIVIDLVGYRRYGHNEGDEPAYTQPRMYEKIKNHPTVRDQWVDRLVTDDVISREDADGLAEAFEQKMQAARQTVKENLGSVDPSEPDIPTALAYAACPTIGTAVPIAELIQLNDAIHAWPADFTVFPKLARQLERRRDQFVTQIDWGHAEALAFATLLAQGVPIRLTGEDTQRGTFSHRHSVLHDVDTGQKYTPLSHVAPDQSSFRVWNSPLSEVAVLGFEYGYSVLADDALVLWEAQFGDFANVSQAIIDQFIVSGRSKWSQESRLVMLLPHGYEGQGPEHSSARLERFLDLAAEDNVRIANCTTPAQYFHLLRLQALCFSRRPLIVMTPKSLLRHPAARSTAESLASGGFRSVLPGVRGSNPYDITRLILCSGKVFYDLIGSDSWPQSTAIDVARIEMLYPFPDADIRDVLAGLPNLREVVWLQEEPANMGAWRYMHGPLRAITGDGLALKVVARPERASPAPGTASMYLDEQQDLIGSALRI
ncbi:MAG: 2-oxoglutarate dehydrogenase E1 component [Gemmatimonadota bacterium]